MATTKKQPAKKPAAKKAPAKTAPARKPPAKPAAPTVSKAALKKAAKMRDQGATWNQIREATGTRLGSSQWFRAWEREGIPHRPAGQPKPEAKS